MTYINTYQPNNLLFKPAYIENDEITDEDIEDLDIGAEITTGILANQGLRLFSDEAKVIPLNGIRQYELFLMERIYHQIESGTGIIKIVTEGNFKQTQSLLIDRCQKRIKGLREKVNLKDPYLIQKAEASLSDFTNVDIADVKKFRKKVLQAILAIMKKPCGRELLLKLTANCPFREITITLKQGSSKMCPLKSTKRAVVALGMDDKNMQIFELKPSGQKGIRTQKMEAYLYHELCHCLDLPGALWKKKLPNLPDFDKLSEFRVITGWQFDPNNSFFRELGADDSEPRELLTTSERKRLLQKYIEINTEQTMSTQQIDNLFNKLVRDDDQRIFQTLFSPLNETGFETGLSKIGSLYPRADHRGFPARVNKCKVEEFRDYVLKVIKRHVDNDEIRRIDDEGFDWNTPLDEDNNNALMLCALHENDSAAECLLQKAHLLKLNEINSLGDTALSLFSKKVIKLLFSKERNLSKIIKRINICCMLIKLGGKITLENVLKGTINGLIVFLINNAQDDLDVPIKKFIKQLVESLSPQHRLEVIKEAENKNPKAEGILAFL